MKQLTAVSLFAGVGGFDLALERSGVKVVASVEIDQKASAILAKQFPNSKLFNDIKEVTGEQLINAGFDPRNGIITGGFPCQDLSMAGKRAGLGGARSGLFWEICRLLDETKAQNFILENVPGLLSSNQGKDMAAVLEALVERGYRIGYRVLDAQYFGVPQRRRRVFIVGSFGNTGIAPEKVLAIAEGRSRYLEAGKQKRESITRKITKGIRNSEWWNGSDVADTLTVSSNEQRMPDKNKMQMIVFEKTINFELSNEKEIANCLPAELYHHGSVVNQDVDSGHLIVFDPHRSDGVRIQDKTMNTLTAIMGTGGNNTPMVAYPMHGAMVGRKDTAGPNGSGFLGENDPSYTLTASNQSRHGVGIINNNSSAVRRLTPLECERLQGFPDDWTSGQADQHRYKQMGNAVAVPVVEWIIKRLVGEINA